MMTRPTPGPATAGYWFDVTCPSCGGPVAHVAGGTGGLDTRAITRCGPCGRHWAVVVTLADVSDDVGVPATGGEGGTCGTYSGYAHGCRCGDCRAAAAAYQRQRRARLASARGAA